MRIVIDGGSLSSQKTGIGYYTKNLLTEMCRLAPGDEFFARDLPLRWLASNERVTLPLEDSEFYRSLQGPPLPARFRRVLRATVRKMWPHIPLEECDVFFGTNFRGVFASGLQTVLTIHDMAHEYYPETIKKEVLKYFRDEFPAAVERSRMLVAVSEATRRDIIKVLKVPPEKVTVVLNGVSPHFSPVEDPLLLAAVRQRYCLPRRFMLMVGSVQPRKNVEGVLTAFVKLVKKSPHFPLHLVVAGETGWKNEDLGSKIRSLGLEDRVTFPGYISEEHLPALYSLAEIFIFPSFYEGFGLPVVEAMACGVPVVTSNSSCLPEIAGDAAVLVDPHDAADIASGIARLIEDHQLRQQCITRGMERAKLFTWESAARQLLHLFEKISCK